MDTFGNAGWRKQKIETKSGPANSSFSNKEYPFYIIDLKLPDKTDQLVYIPSVPISQFAAHVIDKHNINPEHTEYIHRLI